MENARLALAVLLFPTLNENFTVVDDLNAAPALPPFPRRGRWPRRENPDLRAAARGARASPSRTCAPRATRSCRRFSSRRDYGIEANEFALHSRVAADPGARRRCRTSGYFVTVNLSVPIWDWGGLRSKLRQTADARSARRRSN